MNQNQNQNAVRSYEPVVRGAKSFEPAARPGLHQAPNRLSVNSGREARQASLEKQASSKSLQPGGRDEGVGVGHGRRPLGLNSQSPLGARNRQNSVGKDGLKTNLTSRENMNKENSNRENVAPNVRELAVRDKLTSREHGSGARSRQASAGARDRQSSGGCRQTGGGVNQPTGTRARTPPLKPREQTEKRPEVALTSAAPKQVQSLRAGRPIDAGHVLDDTQHTATENVAPAAPAETIGQSPKTKIRAATDAVLGENIGQSPKAKIRASSSPPHTPLESHVASAQRVSTGRCSSPSTVPAVTSPHSGCSNPSPGLCLRGPEINDTKQGTSNQRNLPEVPIDCDPVQIKTMVDVAKIELQELPISPPKASPKASPANSDTEVSFDLSPIQRRVVSNRCSLSDIGSLAPSTIPVPAASSRDNSREHSRENSMDNSARMCQAEARRRAVSEGEESNSQQAVVARADADAKEKASKVSVMRNLWEQRALGSVTDVTPTDRQRSTGRAGGSTSWLRCSSDNLVRRMRREERTTNKLTERLLEKLRTQIGDTMINSPADTSGDTSGLLSIEDDFDALDSPKTQLCRGILQNSAAMWRAQRKMTKAVIRVLSLDGVKDDIGSFAAVCHAAPELPINVDHEVCGNMEVQFDEQNVVASLKIEDETKSCAIEQFLAKSGPAGGRRASIQSVQSVGQPESEADVMAPSPVPREEPSICLTDEAEPEREPKQPLESPRDDFIWGPAVQVADHIEAAPSTELNSSSEPASPPDVDAEQSILSDDSFIAAAPRPCEDGMQRSDALLPRLQQQEMNRELRIIVPDGMDAETRQVSFTFENKSHTVIIPDHFEVGTEVPITISKRPALEHNQRILQYRGIQNTQDRCSIVDSLRHGARPAGDETNLINSVEMRNRQYLYTLLRGNAMHPLLPWTPEEDDVPNVSFTSSPEVPT